MSRASPTGSPRPADRPTIRGSPSRWPVAAGPSRARTIGRSIGNEARSTPRNSDRRRSFSRRSSGRRSWRRVVVGPSRPRSSPSSSRRRPTGVAAIRSTSGPIRSLASQSPVLAEVAELPRGTRWVGPGRNLPMVVGAAPIAAYRTLDLRSLPGLTRLADAPVGPPRVTSALRAAGVGVRVVQGGEADEGLPAGRWLRPSMTRRCSAGSPAPTGSGPSAIGASVAIPDPETSRRTPRRGPGSCRLL